MSSLFETEALDTADTNLFGETVAVAEETGAYRVLARKYRPQTFNDLVGQEVLVKTLTNAFATGRLAQAWMLTGVRGVGKTTTARIIAKGLNCTGPGGGGNVTIEPCGLCPTCTAISDDRCVDVMEVDAASRTGVDDMREILDGVRYAPVMARYKVYIIDEVHMLSKNAFNALLKTLEEPPSHVKFIFATTEIRKVPVTVLSRCQRFDLRRIESATLVDYFASIATAEGFTVEPEALRLIARAADGSARDGLSLLDQSMALSEDNTVTGLSVNTMLGLADRGAVVDLYVSLTTGKPDAALQKFDTMLAAGADALTVLHDVADLTHLLTRGKVLPELANDMTVPELDRQAMQRLLPEHTLAGLTRIWQILMKGVGEVQQALHPQQAAAMVLVRIAYAANLPPPGELVGKLGSGNTTGTPTGGSTPAPSGGGTKMLRAVAGGMAIAAPVIDTVINTVTEAAPQTAAQQISALSLDIAADYRRLVALFQDKREVGLYNELRSDAQLVSLQPGRLEISPGPRSSQNFAGKVGKLLSDWTGDRWIVSIARNSAAAQSTLAVQDKAADDARRAEALEHPVVATTLQVFSGAQLVEVKQLTTATKADADADTDETTLLTDDE